MKTVILYDSWFSNTELIAKAVAQELGDQALLCKVDFATHLEFEDIDLLIVGSPTHAGVEAPALQMTP
jgi:flavodoxin